MSGQSDEATPPPEVLRALEALEGAKTPTEIGAAYATVLAWREGLPHPSSVLSKIVTLMVAIAAALYLGGKFDDLSEFWRGAVFGGCVVAFLYAMGGWTPRRSPLRARADTAVDRWRHAFPP